MAELHCPRCNAPMLISKETGVMACRDGEPLPKAIRDQLIACYVTGTQMPRETNATVRWGGKWFCPGCGIPCVEEPQGTVCCERCGKNMTSFVYQFIEFVWHKPLPGDPA